MTIKKIFWVVLIITLITWFGVGIYFFTNKIPEKTKKIALQPSPQEKAQPLPKKLFPFPGSSYVPTGAKIMEGIIAESKVGEFVLASEGGIFPFFLTKESLFYFPEGGKGASIGSKLRVYYKEKNGQYDVIYGVAVE